MRHAVSITRRKFIDYTLCTVCCRTLSKTIVTLLLLLLLLFAVQFAAIMGAQNAPSPSNNGMFFICTHNNERKLLDSISIDRFVRLPCCRNFLSSVSLSTTKRMPQVFRYYPARYHYGDLQLPKKSDRLSHRIIGSSTMGTPAATHAAIIIEMLSKQSEALRRALPIASYLHLASFYVNPRNLPCNIQKRF